MAWGLRRLTIILVIPAAISATPEYAAQANTSPATSAPSRGPYVHRLSIEIGTGKLLSLGGDAANVFVADPKIAEVRPASANALFIFGIAPGRTTVAAISPDGHPLAQYDISVLPSSFAASEAQVALDGAMPGLGLRVTSDPHGLTLSGQVTTPEEQARAAAIVSGFLDDGQALLNQVAVTASTQVTLEVRIAEISRTVERELGVNWTKIGGGTFAFATLNGITDAIATATFSSSSGGLSGVIDALATDGLAKILAEPTLTVMSGQPASFDVGGSYPIPVGQTNGAVTIDFKNYGVQLDFVPTVLSSGRINLHVAPQFSQLSNEGAITESAGNSTFQIPALLVRKAETTVELGSGQSFAIAGLLENTETNNSTATPVLGEIPVLGALFRSNSVTRAEDELVILVTPYIVRPVDNAAALRAPDAGAGPPSDLGRLLLLRQIATGQPTVPMRIPGQAGFIVQ
jgi:pilus assembly protein CpaC